MAITKAAHADLSTRLLALVAEYAAASDRAGAEAKATALLECLPVSESDADVAIDDEDAKRMVAEIERRGQVIAEITAANEAGAAKLAETQQALDAARAELDQAKADLEAATKPTDNQ